MVFHLSRNIITFIKPVNNKFLTNKCKLNVIQVAFIAHKDHIDQEVIKKKAKPWPYETKKFTYFHDKLKLDKTTHRFDENTKVISIDGTVAVGKKEFGQKLAKELGMRYFPQPDIDSLYVDHTGFDYCTLNKLLPESAQFLNMKMLHANPKHKQLNDLQFLWYQHRCYNYVDAMAHMYSTGQGIIVDRNPWSDIVFLESMYKHGFHHKSFFDFYWRMRKITTFYLQKPHVVIYLDITPDESLKRIKARKAVDADSKYVNKDFLETLEHFYKTLYLIEMEPNCELLVYDWKTYGDIDVVVEDLEKIDFDKYNRKGLKMKDWHLFEEEQWNRYRRFYCNKKDDFYAKFMLPTYDVDGLDMQDDVSDLYFKVVNEYAPTRCDKEYYVEKRGFWNVAFKGFDNYRKVQNIRWHLVPK